MSHFDASKYLIMYSLPSECQFAPRLMIDEFYVIIAVLFLLAMHNAHDSLNTGGPERPSRRGGVREEGDLCPQTAQAPQRGWLLWKQVARKDIIPFITRIS